MNQRWQSALLTSAGMLLGMIAARLLLGHW